MDNLSINKQVRIYKRFQKLNDSYQRAINVRNGNKKTESANFILKPNPYPCYPAELVKCKIIFCNPNPNKKRSEIICYPCNKEITVLSFKKIEEIKFNAHRKFTHRKFRYQSELTEKEKLWKELQNKKKDFILKKLNQVSKEIERDVSLKEYNQIIKIAKFKHKEIISKFKSKKWKTNYYL